MVNARATLQSRMNAKLGHQRISPRHEKAFIKNIYCIDISQSMCRFKFPSVCYGSS